MTFLVTYRDAAGAVRTETVEAAHRAACFAQMKGRGISPISVREGTENPARRHGDRHGRGAAPTPSGGKNLAARALIAVLAATLALACAWWWMTAETKEAPSATKAARAPEKSPDVPRSPETAPGLAATNAVAAVTNAVAEAAGTKPKERHETVSIHTNNMGKVVEKWIGADGKLHMSVRYARRPVFDNASDDQLAMAVGGGGAQAIPPIPMTAASEREFLASLKKPIVIAEDDSEDVKRLKEAVRDAREQMKQLMDSGMSYREALAEHQRLVNENVDTRNQCMAELKRLVDEGDREGAEQYLKTMNVALGQMGIPALTMPLSKEELNAARAKRRAALEAAKQSGR